MCVSLKTNHNKQQTWRFAARVMYVSHLQSEFIPGCSPVITTWQQQPLDYCAHTHLVNLCYPAGVVEDTLGQGGLPRVDVSRDPDVADSLVGKDPGGTRAAAVNEHLGILNTGQGHYSTTCVCLPIVKHGNGSGSFG